MTEQAKTPWWFPQLCDAAYFARLRQDYPVDKNMSDEELHDKYADSQKYAVTWDHIGDAYAEYEPLADAFLALAEALHAIVEDAKKGNATIMNYKVEAAIAALQAAGYED